MLGRIRVFVAGVAALAAVSVSGAASAATPETCETPRVAVYFLHGEDSPTEGADTILSMAGEAAAQCDAAIVGVVARFDPATEGDLSLALKRLAAVADRLSRTGVPLDRIRLAAQPADGVNPAQGPGRIDIRVVSPEEPQGRPQPAPAGRTPANLA